VPVKNMLVFGKDMDKRLVACFFWFSVKVTYIHA